MNVYRLNEQIRLVFDLHEHFVQSYYSDVALDMVDKYKASIIIQSTLESITNGYITISDSIKVLKHHRADTKISKGANMMYTEYINKIKEIDYYDN